MEKYSSGQSQKDTSSAFGEKVDGQEPYLEQARVGVIGDGLGVQGQGKG